MSKYLLRGALMNEEMGGEQAPAGAEQAPAEQAPASDAKWYDSLPQDMREDQNITKFESVEVMAKSWQNAQRMIGADKIPMPQTDEDWGNVYGRLGRPDESSAYEIALPEGYELNQEAQDGFKAVAHGLGLSQKQVEGLANWQFEQEAAGGTANAESVQATQDAATNALKSEWGEAYDQNTAIAARAASEFLSESDKEFMNTAMIDGVTAGNHPALLKLFHGVAKGMMEPSKLEGLATTGKQTPQEIQDNISRLMGNPAYTDRSHPEHKSINRKVQEAFQLQAG